MVSRIHKEGKQISAKKIFLLVLLLSTPFFFVVGQENPLDLVLILDISSSMSGSYQNTIDYVTGRFLKEFLRIGDTFHLISFSDTPRLEITRRISGWGDVETIIGRLFLLYPLEPYSDISGALAYGERYVASIPGTREKKVVLISDGDHNPRQGGTAEGSTQNLISLTTARLNQAGIDFHYVPVPVMGNGPPSGRNRMLPQNRPPTAAQAQPAAPPVQPAPPAGQTAAQTARPEPGQTRQAAPQTGQPARPEPGQTRQAAPQAEQSARPEPGQTRQAAPQAEQPAAQIPETRQPETEAPAPSTNRKDKEASPKESAPGYRPGDISLFGLPLSWFIGGILGVILILALIILLMTRRLHTSPNRTFAHAADNSLKKPVPPEKTEPPKDDRAPQNANLSAPYPAVRHQNEGKKPGTIFEAPWQERKPITPAAPLPNTEDRPIPNSVPKAPPERGADMAPDRPAQYPEAGPGAPWQERKPITPAAPVPKTEDRPIPNSVPKTPPDMGRADTASLHPISHDGPRKIVPMKSYQKNTQTDNRPLMLSLFVEDQNTNIGRRNIHTVKPGYSFTIGGGKSDFLIFLVPIPPRIAELRSNGAQCTFVPRRPEFFPDLGSQQIPNCVGIPIRIISERQYELFIRIDRYEDPLIALNRLLHSVDIPGYWQEPG